MVNPNPIEQKLTDSLFYRRESVAGIHELVNSLLNEENLSADELVENVEDFFKSRLNRLAESYNN